MDLRKGIQEIDFADMNMAGLFGEGVNNAIEGLSQMAGREVKVVSMDIKKVQVKDIPDLFGGPEALIIAIYVEIFGKANANGHMVVVYKPEVAFGLVDLLLDQQSGSTTELNDMENSTLGEVGNIMGSFFLNYLSDTTGQRLKPSPPAVMMDMAGAVLDSTLANILAYSDETYIVDTVFGTKDRQVSGTFMIIPNPSLEVS
ncbi:MAG: chemotaxis protein CheC [Dehalococcoidales bacterium]|nr:chemotaxis protein CheC [Dehalococcoidales bacterium]